MNRIAIIGTGITGLSIAHYCKILKPQALITLFDKSRRPGGRLSTRTTRSHPSFFFDHGVPLILQSQLSFELQKTLKELNAIQIRPLNVLYGDFAKNPNVQIIKKGGYVGKRGLESIPIQIHNSLKAQTHFDQRIRAITFKEDKYFLDSQSKSQFGPFDQVFCCIPLPQANAIHKIDCNISSEIHSEYNSVWTIMLALKQPLSERHFDYGLSFNNELGAMGFMKQNFKVNEDERPQEELWVFHMTNLWSNKHKNLTPEQTEAKFIEIAKKTLNREDFEKDIIHLKAHRWLYGQPFEGPLQEISSDNKRLILTGDWVDVAGTIGQSWQSGKRVAEKYISHSESKL